ncbi:MAG: type II secretion system F family protein [Sedimentisphaerales bacterium]|jgi:type II secretory pathway component PulF|nr:type II secretion system F family protein [Sedimentisphaerales bacterium]
MRRLGIRSELYYNLASLLNAGVPLLQAISIVARTADAYWRRILDKLHADVRKGNSLSDAMASLPHVFPRFDTAVISACEQTGKLDEAFRMLSDWHRFRRNLARTIASALVYPAVILHLAAFVFYLPSLVLGHSNLWQYI